MKIKLNYLLFAFALTMMSFGFSSCSKDEDDPGAGGTPKANFLDASVNGKKIVPIGAPIFTYDANTGNFDMLVKDNDQVSSLAVYFNVNGGNTQNFGSGDCYGNVQTSTFNDGLYSATSGTLNLTTNDKSGRVVAGNFTFTAVNSEMETVSVTGGNFYIKY